MLCEHTAEYINAICFENPPYKTIANKSWSNEMFSKLEALKIEWGIQILILESENLQTKKLFPHKEKALIKSISDKKGFIYHKASRNYL